MYDKLNFDSEMISFINTMSPYSRVISIIESQIAYGPLRKFLNKSGDFIKRDGKDTISYIPKSKLLLDHNGFDDTKYRTPMKIGRFVTKFMRKETIRDYGIGNYDTETFVNLFKSYFDRDESRLKVISGDEILKYYHLNSYHRPNGSCIGQLWNSCMRYEEKNKFMKIYSSNPDKIKMLIYLNEDGTLRTRALLWEDCVNHLGVSYKVMDRIYSIFDHDVLFFKSWAIKNGYVHKYEQSNKYMEHFTDSDGIIQLSLKVQLDNHILSHYPFIDTFKYYSKKYGTLSNSQQFPYEYVLVQNDGALEKVLVDDYDEVEIDID